MFKIGDSVWVARAEYRDTSEVCPVCYGKREVTLILGNGDNVVLPCDYCGRGYNSPTGSVTERTWFTGAELAVIEGVDVSQTREGEKVEYRSSHYILYPENIFTDKEAAIKRGEAISAQVQHDQNTRTEYIKADAKKTFTWNAGYHLREAKRKEAEAARHREKAKLCKERSNTE